MIFGFGFWSVLYGVGFGLNSGSCTFFTFGFGLVSVLGKTYVLIPFVLAGFGFFPISSLDCHLLPSSLPMCSLSCAIQLAVIALRQLAELQVFAP